MSPINLTVMYGHLEGAGGDFARDPTGYLSIEAGIFAKHGLNISWQHVQGTEERYRRLENGSAQISLLVGRASLQHFLGSKSTRIVGAVMNSCPYYLIGPPAARSLKDLGGKVVACREGPSRNTPIAETFYERAGFRVGTDLALQFVNGDQDAFHSLVSGDAQAALLPRPFGFIAEEQGYRRLNEWPAVVDDPLPITIETTSSVVRERGQDLQLFLAAHSEGIRHFKANRADAMRVLTMRFGHSPTLAAKILDDYVPCMDDDLKVNFERFEKLLSQIAPAMSANARQVALEWVAPGRINR